MRRKGQSILEYMIIFAGVVAAIVAATALFNDTTGTKGYSALMKKSSDTLNTQAAKLGGLAGQ